MIGSHLAKLSLALIGIVTVSSDMFWKRVEHYFFRANIPASVQEPFRVRGIHLTAWVAGHPKARARIDDLLDKTELTSVAIAIKEFNGDVYIPGVQQTVEWGTYRAAVPDLKDYVFSLKKRGVYTIARMVVFKDDLLTKKKPEWAVTNPDGSVWKDKKGYSWADPYRR